MSETSEQPHDESIEAPELDEMLDEIGEVEKERKKRTLVMAVAIVAVVSGLVAWLAFRADELLGPDLDVEAGEQRLLEDTGDPVCRSMLEEIRAIWGDYLDLEFDYEDHAWGDDEEELERLHERAVEFRERLDEQRSRIEEAQLREDEIEEHPPVEEQLEEWFGNQDNEFRILEELTARRLRILRDQEVEQREGMWTDPEDLRETVLMTINENFEEFRVWVIRGGHPCGPPPEGVDPWEPGEDGDIEGMSRPR